MSDNGARYDVEKQGKYNWTICLSQKDSLSLSFSLFISFYKYESAKKVVTPDFSGMKKIKLSVTFPLKVVLNKYAHIILYLFSLVYNYPLKGFKGTFYEGGTKVSILENFLFTNLALIYEQFNLIILSYIYIGSWICS